MTVSRSSVWCLAVVVVVAVLPATTVEGTLAVGGASSSSSQQSSSSSGGAGGQQQQQQQQQQSTTSGLVGGYVPPYPGAGLSGDFNSASPLTHAIGAGAIGSLHPLAPVSQEGYQCPKGWCYSQGIFCGYNVCPDVQGFKNLYYCKGYGWAPKLVDSCSLACVDSRKGQDSCYPL